MNTGCRHATATFTPAQPGHMWISCSDSRVPANQITALEPGKVFVHRHGADVMLRCDFNPLSTIQCAVDLLRDEPLIGCDHDGCDGEQAGLCSARIGLADNSMSHTQDVPKRFKDGPQQLPKLHQAAISQVLSCSRPQNLRQQRIN